MQDLEKRESLFLSQRVNRRRFLEIAGAMLVVAGCGQEPPGPSPTPTATTGPPPEISPSPTIAQLTPDQFSSEEQQLYQNGQNVDVFLEDRTLLLDPTLGNAALTAYISGIEQSVSVDNVFRFTLRSNQQGAPDIHGLVPKGSQAGNILFPAAQTLPNIVAFEGSVVNVKILVFSDTDIYSDQGLALFCNILKIH